MEIEKVNLKLEKGKKRQKLSMSAIFICLVSGIVTIVIVVSTLWFILTYSRTLYQNNVMNSEQTVSGVASTVGLYESDMKEDLKTVCKELEICENQTEIENILQTVVRIRSNIISVIVYDKDGIIMDYGVAGQELKNPILRGENLSFQKEVFDQNTEFSITRPHVQNLFVNYYPWVVTVASKMPIDYFGKEVYVTMDIRFSSIASYVDDVGIGRHGYCFVMDQEGKLIYHPQQQLIYTGLKAENMEEIKKLSDGVHERRNLLYVIQTIKNGNWRVVGVSYVDEIADARIRNICYMVSILMISCILVGVISSWLLSKTVSQPVHKLEQAMRQFEQDVAQFEYKPVEGVREIQNLSASFGHMVQMIQRLMEKIKEEEITLRKTELRALQAQINPHFLYNTLDSIQWMCESEKTREASQMISALARLFRISISKGRELIPIQDEIIHAKNYLVIQSFRYKNQFHYEFHIDEETLPYLCNKITLQPLIENAIYHGIDRMVDEGIIDITVKADEKDIILIVKDNGVGMTKEQCSKILEKENNQKSGIGIKNVNDRIKIYFGEMYGLSVKSELDEGTEVMVRFPKILEEMSMV